MDVVTNKSISKEKRPLQLWLNLAIFAVIIASIIFVLQPWRTVQSVKVNAMMLPADKIEKYANVRKYTPYWRIIGQTQFIAQRITEQDDQIDSAKVTLRGNQVTIDIVEKVTAGYVRQSKGWYVINRKGTFSKVANPEGNAPVYSGFKSQQSVKKIAKIFVALDFSLRQNISQIIFSPNKDNTNRLIIIMNDGNTVYATMDTFGSKINYYPGIAAQMPTKGIVDLQYGAYSYAYGTTQTNKTTKNTENNDKQK
ncbi:cell division protein FtsQ/DivIB [Leuconostoc miyukkimchii]|uniref:cell division protein FtsQ/DivIB n=1 Tax=Leuconostoc miyukkimchii TaxID=910540 RepID=UPI001C7CCC7E|nr:cell division protein FtsQ/DivIB [Leuconostoc miyukkimchii]